MYADSRSGILVIVIFVKDLISGLSIGNLLRALELLLLVRSAGASFDLS